MKKYLAILSNPYDEQQSAKEHIARSAGNGISRCKLFTLHMMSPDKKSYIYRVCRVVTDKDFVGTAYCEGSIEQWEEHLKAHTERVKKWLREKSTKVIEKNSLTHSLLEGL